MPKASRWTCIAAAFGAAAGAMVGAAGESTPAADDLEVVAVVAPLDDAAAAANAQTADADALAAFRSLDVGEFLKRRMASVFVNEAQGNPLQPDLQYRGFVSSPLLGLPQGIAVYQDGVRVNEPFGDTVSWALIPVSAIERVALATGANPLFGLNALGGAVAIDTKDGFGQPGAVATLQVGDFGRRSLAGEISVAVGERWGYFGTVAALREDGWRDYSPTAADQAFAKLSWRGGTASLDASLAAAATDLVGNGAAPVALLAERPSAVFTRPDRTRNHLGALNLRASVELRPGLAVKAAAYRRRSNIATYNGDDSDYAACDDDAALLCLEAEPGDADDDAGSPWSGRVLDAGGQPVPAVRALIGATINRTRTAQASAGASVQAARRVTLGSIRHRLAVGVAYDRGDVDFRSSTELGRLDATRKAVPGGVQVRGAFVRVAVDVHNASIYIADALRVGSRMRVAAAVRYNRADVVLEDQLGTALNGSHRFRRANPALRVEVQATGTVAAYAAYGETSRAPSPVELTCADADAPCRLPNAFLADPPLSQVVVRTAEAGLRGIGAVAWRAGVFEARSEDDILFVSAGPRTSEGYFDNVGRTRRRGLELALESAQRDAPLRWFVNCTLLRATFEDAFSVPSPNHPSTAGGGIAVAPGDRLPLVPERLAKAGATWRLRPWLSIAGELLHAGRVRLRGDEANLAPALPGYTVLNLRLDVRLRRGVQAFASIDNALDERYATFGVFGEADGVLGEGFENPRFVTPAAPRGAWVGLELRR